MQDSRESPGGPPSAKSVYWLKKGAGQNPTLTSYPVRGAGAISSKRPFDLHERACDLGETAFEVDERAFDLDETAFQLDERAFESTGRSCQPLGMVTPSTMKRVEDVVRLLLGL